MSINTTDYQAFPRLMVAATRKSSGKTTISIGLAAAFVAQGLDVRPFKKGPDFIDPQWLTLAAGGRACRNLDFFIMGAEQVRKSFIRFGLGGDLCLIEGNHGLFDGQDVAGGDCGAALADLLDAPVLLVVDVKGLARGVAPLVRGHLDFPGGERIKGVLLNNIGSARHEKRLIASLEQYCQVPVLGAIPRNANMGIDERHLGLQPVEEKDELSQRIVTIRDFVATHVDLAAIMALARNAPPMVSAGGGVPAISVAKPSVRVAYAVDQAFHFYYPDNLEALRWAGVELVGFSMLTSTALPQADGLYIGGGFPEMFMQTLEDNRELMHDIRRAVDGGMPVYAECGGLMVLAEGIHWGGRYATMAGVLPIEVTMYPRPQGYGYMEVEGVADVISWPRGGDRVQCHEFHYSQVSLYREEVRHAFRVTRGTGMGEKLDGILYKSVLATYAHFHAAGSPGWVDFLVDFWRKGRRGI